MDIVTLLDFTLFSHFGINTILSSTVGPVPGPTSIKNQKILVTGGAGFIGGALITWLLEKTQSIIVNVDNIIYEKPYELNQVFEEVSTDWIKSVKIKDPKLKELFQGDIK